MEKVKNRDTQFELVVFLNRCWTKRLPLRSPGYLQRNWTCKRSSEGCTPFATSLPKPGAGVAGTKSGCACLEDGIYSGSASPGNPAPSTATRSAAKLTRRVVGILQEPGDIWSCLRLMEGSLASAYLRATGCSRRLSVVLQHISSFWAVWCWLPRGEPPNNGWIGESSPALHYTSNLLEKDSTR